MKCQKIRKNIFGLLLIWCIAVVFAVPHFQFCMAAEADIGSQQEEEAEQKADEAYDSLGKSASKGIDTTKNRLGKMSVSSDIGSKGSLYSYQGSKKNWNMVVDIEQNQEEKGNEDMEEM